MSDSLRPHGLQPTSLLHPWDFPGKSIGMGCHCLLLFVTIILLIYTFKYTNISNIHFQMTHRSLIPLFASNYVSIYVQFSYCYVIKFTVVSFFSDKCAFKLGFSRQTYQNGLLFPSPGDLPDPGSPILQADALPSEPPVKLTTSLYTLQLQNFYLALLVSSTFSHCVFSLIFNCILKTVLNYYLIIPHFINTGSLYYLIFLDSGSYFPAD